MKRVDGKLAGLAIAMMLAGVAHVPAHADTDARGGVWSAHNHGCNGGNRTDALHRDIDGTLWAGCGTNATGYGLFRSADGGATWAAATVSPATALDEFRVSSITRGWDNALYIAGFKASTRQMVLRLVTTAAPYPVTDALVGTAQLGRQFHVGSYRDLADGRAIAEALNGTDLLYRSDSGIGSNAGAWTIGGLSTQILDMVVYGDAFYGAGSRNVEPPRVYLPPLGPSALPYQFQTMELQSGSGWEGELWGVAVNNRRLVAVGIDQDSNIGKIFVGSDDLYVASNYTETSISPITGDNFSWGRGACIARNRIVVVGERQPLGSGTGRVLLSDDDGATFTNITPSGAPATISKCVIEPDGTLIVAGAGSYVGIRQDPDWIFRNDYERP